MLLLLLTLTVPDPPPVVPDPPPVVEVRVLKPVVAQLLFPSRSVPACVGPV